jgi:hypothetical protein
MARLLASNGWFREERNMDENTNILEEIFHDLFSSMEALETQNTAILQFLKEKGIATDEELASHLEQAGNASSVRWRGVRVRADYLFASAIKAAEQASEKEPPKPTDNTQEAKAATKQSDEKQTPKGAGQVATNAQPRDDQSENDRAENARPEADGVGASREKDVEQGRNQPVDDNNKPGETVKEKAA